MHILLVAIFAFFVMTAAALAQQQAAPPPTDLELEHARAEMLATQLQYFVAYLRKEEAQLQQAQSDAKVLAAWWASYVAGLEPKVGEK